MRSAVFFERDGVLNLVKEENGQQLIPSDFKDFRLNAKARVSVQRLKHAGYILLVITNQPGLSQGAQSRRELDRMHAHLERELLLDGVLICPHDANDQCPCRKPKAGLLKEAAFKWHLDLERSFVISDKWQDAQAAHVASCRSILLQSRWNGSGHHDFIVPDLDSAVSKILELQPLASTSNGSPVLETSYGST